MVSSEAEAEVVYLLGGVKEKEKRNVWVHIQDRIVPGIAMV